MKKCVCVVIFALLLVSLCSCSLIPNFFANNKSDGVLPGEYNVTTIKGWMFQQNTGTNDYSLFFGLLDDNDTFISASVDVDIKIVNDMDEEVYKATKSVTPDDFGYYSSSIMEERYIAEIRIPSNDITPGQSESGTVYLTVYKDGILRFDEVNCSALYCLPVSDIEIASDNLPQEINLTDYMNELESVIKVEELSYEFDKELLKSVEVTISGIKTYEKESEYGSSYDTFNYKIYDDEGFVVDNGMIFLSNLNQGDKFKESFTIYGLTPGKTYKISFSE